MKSQIALWLAMQNEAQVYFYSRRTQTASTMIDDRSVQSVGPTKLKRPSTHLALPSSPKRLKVASPMGMTGPALDSPPARADGAGHFKAENWFNDTNEHASRNAPFLDNDPPFYINRQTSSDGNRVCAVSSDGSSIKHAALGKPTAPTRSLLARMESSASNSEDFRSVIDDLTIKNKKLKRKLRQYEKLHCSHLREDKLFEIRIHGLAAHRKRELERTLRSFASSIEDLPAEIPALDPGLTRPTGSVLGTSKTLHATATGGFPLADSMVPLRKPSSASTSCSKPVDSAYASMSGQTGNSQAQTQEKGPSDRLLKASQTQRNVKSYLHDVSETLMPKHTMAMSERSKSKLVIKRLEEIFTGKGAAFRHQTQSRQQQEVSQSAAQAELNRVDPQGRGRSSVKEGVREARILADDADLQVDSISEANLVAQRSRQSSHDGRASARDPQASRDQSPDQRPTRPLDLDLHRAQVPADNIDYIRHLGLSSPTASADPGADDGWVYLNLLISMAQLHTLNVTPEFIRHAIASVSSKFELSNNGTKVRWRGEIVESNLSPDNDENVDAGNLRSRNPSSPGSRCGSSGNPSQRLPIQDCQESNTALPFPAYESLNNPTLRTKRRPIFLEQESTTASFHYKPLFFHAAASHDSDESDSVINSTASSDPMDNATAINSGINSGSYGLRETEVKLRKQHNENGPIIFYHKARFCTDLSGDPGCATIDESAYYRSTQVPVGCLPESHNDMEEGHGEEVLDAMEVDLDETQTIGSTLDLDELKSCISDCLSSTSSAAAAAPMPMEVSGLCGIQPEDNFMVNVRVRHHDKRIGPSPNSSYTLRCPPNRLLHGTSSLARDVPRSQPMQGQVTSEIMSMAKTNLKPSSMPSPSYAHLPFSSSESEDEEDEEEPPVIPYNKSSRSRGPYEMTPRPSDFLIGSSPEETRESSYASTSSGSGDDDVSIDLLAHARVLDPDTIAARERDYDNNAMPVGSAAATAGESISGLMNTATKAESENSMSANGDGESRMNDSDGEC